MYYLHNESEICNLYVICFREMSEVDSSAPALVYLDVFIAQEVNFIVWKYCLESNIYLMAVPRKLFWCMKPFKIGAMAKYSSKMLFYMHHR